MEDKPFEDRVVPKVEIDWGRSLWWWYPLTRAIHPAMRITALLTSALAIGVMALGLRAAAWLFNPRFTEAFQDQYMWLFDPRFAQQLQERFVGPVLNVRLAPIQANQNLFFETLGLREIAYLTFCLLWLTVVFGFFGGILTRRAAVELGQRTIAPWGETIRLVGSRMLAYLWVTGMHMVALAGLLLLPFLAGLIAQLGPAVGGVLLLLLIPLVFAVGRLVLSMFICYPLAVGAISCERNADAFEGFSRSNNYFFQRPVLFTLCVIALAAIGYVGYAIVYWSLYYGWHWIRDAFLAGAGLSANDLFAPASAENTYAIRLVRWIVRGSWVTNLFIASYWFSYVWSANASTYLICRRSVDNVDLDVIDSPAARAAEPLPQLPPKPQ